MFCTNVIINMKKVNVLINVYRTQLTQSVLVCTWGLNITTDFRACSAARRSSHVAHSASCQWKMQLHAITIAAMFSHVYTIQSAHKSLSRKHTCSWKEAASPHRKKNADVSQPRYTNSSSSMTYVSNRVQHSHFSTIILVYDAIDALSGTVQTIYYGHSILPNIYPVYLA